MSIAVECPHCQVAFRCKDEFAGKRVKCPQCTQSFVIAAPAEAVATAPRQAAPPPAASVSTPPGSQHSPAPPKPAPTRKAAPKPAAFDPQALWSSLDVQIEPPPTGLGYRVWSFFVLVVMVILPLIYVAFIATVGWGIYWHLSHNTHWLQADVRGKGYFFVLLGYLAPAVIGGFMLLFMVKPLFARPAKSDDGYDLDPDKEPILHEFITRVCDAVGAPRPSLVEITMDVNAAAGPRYGLFSLLRRDLRLVIGLPLVAGTTVQQLGGILAHEFGHFSQSAGMILSNLIRRISMWFTRVVYERDEWDEWLTASSKEVDIRVGWVLYLARAGVWISRKLLHGLMLIGWAASGRFSQQMEFDADRYGMKIAGSKDLEATELLLPVLGMGHRAAVNTLGEAIDHRKIVDDLPKLIALEAQALPDEVVKELKVSALKDKTSWFSTHPCSRDRIESARAEAEPGVLRAKYPASVLFKDFDRFSRSFTQYFYKHETSLDVKSLTAVPAEEMFRSAQEHGARMDAGVAYTTTSILLSRPVLWGGDVLEPVNDLEQARLRIQKYREKILAIRPEVVATFKQIDKYQTETFMAANMMAMHDCEMKSNKTQARFKTRELTREASRQSRADEEQAAAGLADYEALLSARATLGLRVWRTTTDDPRSHQIPAWIEALRAMEERRNAIFEMTVDLERMRFILDNLGQYNEDERVIRGVHKIGEGLAKRVKAVYGILEEVTHPFIDEPTTVAKAIFDKLPDLSHPIAAFQAADTLSGMAKAVHARLILNLFSFAADAEKHLGLEPLPPVEETAESEDEEDDEE